MKEKKNILDPFLFILIPLFFFFISKITVIYYNNDDYFLSLISSGELTGTPETHLLYVGYLTGVLLSLLYRLVPSVSWYGILLFAYGYLSIMISVCTISCRIKNTWLKYISGILFTFVACTFLWIHIIELQYTTITAFVCAASLVQFYLTEEEESPQKYLRSSIPSLVLLFLSAELRAEACIMFIPTFFFIGISKIVRNRKTTKAILSYGGMILAILILVFGIEKAAYMREDWSSFQDYNTARQNVMDYTTFPDYEEYITEYESLGISYQSYICATTRYQLLLDPNINTAFMQKMDELTSTEFNFISALKAFLERHISSYLDRPLNLIVYAFYFFAIIIVIASRRYHALGDISAVFAGRMIIWSYLLFIGRSPARVSQGIYAMEFLLLLSIIFGEEMQLSEKNKRKAVLCIILSLYAASSLFITLKWGTPHLKVIIEHSKSLYYHSSANREIQIYFSENKDNFYLLDTHSFSYFTENAFHANPNAPCNNLIMGSWIVNSPWSDRVATVNTITSFEEAAVSCDNVFFVFMDYETTDYQYLEDYFQSKYPDSRFIVHDTITTSNGVAFQILRLETN